MARLPYLDKSDLAPEHQDLLTRNINLFRAIAAETAGRETTLDRLTRTVLRAAREMTRDLAVSEEAFTELRRELDPERLTDLVLVIAFYNAVVRFLATMQIDNEPEYQRLLAEFPLPGEPA